MTKLNYYNDMNYEEEFICINIQREYLSHKAKLERDMICFSDLKVAWFKHPKL